MAGRAPAPDVHKRLNALTLEKCKQFVADERYPRVVRVNCVNLVGELNQEESRAGSAASVVPLPDVSELLDGMPRQRGPATVAETTVQVRVPAARIPRPWRLLPTPTGTPFTFAYAAVLALIFQPVRNRLGIEYEDDCLQLGVTWRRDYERIGTFRKGSTFAIHLALKGVSR